MTISLFYKKNGHAGLFRKSQYGHFWKQNRDFYCIKVKISLFSKMDVLAFRQCQITEALTCLDVCGHFLASSLSFLSKIRFWSVWFVIIDPTDQCITWNFSFSIRAMLWLGSSLVYRYHNSLYRYSQMNVCVGSWLWSYGSRPQSPKPQTSTEVSLCGLHLGAVAWASLNPALTRSKVLRCMISGTSFMMVLNQLCFYFSTLCL